jgi:hypothetical protein
MRDLYKEIEEYYILSEWLSKEPSSSIETDDKNEQRSTKLTTYHHKSDFEEPKKYHKDYSGVTHEVSWINNKPKDSMDSKEQKSSLHDAFHLHNHFVSNNTEVGDVVKNKPLEDESGNGNKRSRIYSKGAGFGDVNKTGEQHGIVKQYPEIGRAHV